MSFKTKISNKISKLTAQKAILFYHKVKKILEVQESYKFRN